MEARLRGSRKVVSLQWDTSLSLQLYERMGILLVEVYERLGKSVISACKIDCEQSIIFPCKVTARETQTRERRRRQARETRA